MALLWIADKNSKAPALIRQSTPDSAPTQPLDDRITLLEAQLEKSQSNYNELLRERDELADRYADLENALIRVEKEKARAEQASDLMTGIASKLAKDGQLQVPQTVVEGALLAGSLKRMTADFHAKWGETAPSGGTPESVAYQEDMDALTTEFAAFTKMFESNGMDSITETPSSVSQFQSLQLYSALNLNDTQWQQLDLILNRYFTEGYGQSLNGAARPEVEVESWEQQRETLSNRAFNEIQTLLTPEQAADFERLYNPTFLWEFNVGGK